MAERKFSELDVATSLNDTTTPRRGFGEGIGQGFQDQLGETTLGYLSNVFQREKADNGFGSPLSEDDWRASIYYRDGLKYRPKMTMEWAKSMADSRDHESESQRKYDQLTGSGTAGYWVGGFAGGALDPINLIPLGVEYSAAASLGKAIIRGGAENLALQIGLTPLEYASDQAIQHDRSTSEYYTGLGMSAVLGGVFGGGGYSLGEAARGMRVRADRQTPPAVRVENPKEPVPVEPRTTPEPTQQTPTVPPVEPPKVAGERSVGTAPKVEPKVIDKAASLFEQVGPQNQHVVVDMNTLGVSPLRNESATQSMTAVGEAKGTALTGQIARGESVTIAFRRTKNKPPVVEIKGNPDSLTRLTETLSDFITKHDYDVRVVAFHSPEEMKVARANGWELSLNGKDPAEVAKLEQFLKEQSDKFASKEPDPILRKLAVDNEHLAAQNSDYILSQMGDKDSAELRIGDRTESFANKAEASAYLDGVRKRLGYDALDGGLDRLAADAASLDSSEAARVNIEQAGREAHEQVKALYGKLTDPEVVDREHPEVHAVNTPEDLKASLKQAEASAERDPELAEIIKARDEAAETIATKRSLLNDAFMCFIGRKPAE